MPANDNDKPITFSIAAILTEPMPSTTPMLELLRQHKALTDAKPLTGNWWDRRGELDALEIRMAERAHEDMGIILAPARVHDAAPEFRELAAWNAYRELYIPKPAEFR